jgi:putative flippase GtrA
MTALTAHRLPAARSSALPRETVRQVATFALIGVFSTAVYLVLYVVLRSWTSAGVANALALLITALGNTAANRRLTFDVRGRDGLARHHVAGLLALGVALAITSGSLAALELVRPRHGRLSEIAVLAAANAVATLVRFLLLRLAIERRAVAAVPEPTSPSSLTLCARERILR